MAIPKKINFDLSDQDLKPAPHSIEMERNVLGCIMVNPANFVIGYKYLKPKDMFYDSEHAFIWETMCKMMDAKTEPYIDHLRRYVQAEKPENASIAVTINECWSEAVSDTDFVSYCLKLNEYYIRRILHRMGHFINQEAVRDEKDALKLLGIASDGLGKVYNHIAGMKEKGMAEGEQELIKDLIEVHSSPGKVLGLPSSIPELSEAINGYRKGLFIVIGATQAEGKSTLAFQEIIFLAQMGHRVGIVLLEMKISEFIFIAAANMLNLDIDRAMKGMLQPNELNALGEKTAYIRKLPIEINDTGGQTIGEIKALGRTWAKRGVKKLVIDHMHLIAREAYHNSQEQQFTDIANQLKELAKELDIPVVALAQLSRREREAKPRPHVMSDLKYAGGIEQAADVVIFVYRYEHHVIDKESVPDEIKGVAKLIIAKLRLLKIREVRTIFKGTRFEPYRMEFKKEETPPDNPRAGITNVNRNIEPWKPDEIF